MTFIDASLPNGHADSACSLDVTLLWLPYEIWHTIIFCPVVSSIFYLIFPRLISAVADWMSAILLPHMVWP